MTETHSRARKVDERDPAKATLLCHFISRYTPLYTHPNPVQPPKRS